MHSLDQVLVSLMAHALAMTVHGWLNFSLAAAGALVALGATDRMTRDTDPRIVVAFVTISAGLIGACLSYLLPSRWEPGFDTLVYGGVVALLIGTRKRTIWMHPRWMPLVSALTSVLTWVVFFATVQG